ncbi:MAG: EAL domain-containing protein [Alphaproteobacteria bacterium]|nr:EAL domain-containing protein [Alphaproteobacteria bacterium]MBU1515100.1 EAL domain-containing protein [Alphaproteobacteria bacterium]MBU2093458.1 EAL domain-containing protein [Alphaproteobacteria bacterium]MBU2152306.1 EAL domain-containing protein [Alphaproteobacteria bacterium]MBU2308120.1 EAL domain-containing protein [Alphaproteobacteria bacterium]
MRLPAPLSSVLAAAARAVAAAWPHARLGPSKFKRLSTRLTVLYAALFGVVLLVVSLAVFFAISGAAERQVRGELAATGTVFDRVWTLRSERLQEGASLLSRDFGFRAAAATGDAPTIASALENLRNRMGVDYAFMVDADGQVIGANFAPADRAALYKAFETADDPSGVFMLGGQPYQLVSAPVLSPELIGWVVFAVKLDAKEMQALERLSAIPLNAMVLHRAAGGAWTNPKIPAELKTPAVRRVIDGSLKAGAAPEILNLKTGRTVALVKRLPAIEADGGAVLLLRYPLALALKPYQPLLVIVVLLGLGGLAVVSWGSWALARGVTRPISELDEAAHRLQRGEDAQVAIESADEIGRLSQSFNAMAAEMRERERKITHLALHDGDTGLPNRLALERVVEGFSDWPEGQVFVCALGLDRFSHMRHAIGHKLAAQTVRMVGNRLGGLAPTCGVARISADMLGFVLIADGEAAALDDVQRLLDALEQPVRVAGEPIDVALSVGVTPLDGADVGASVERASIALDQARSSRRKTAVFDAEAYGDPAANLSLMSNLLTGILQDQLVLWHQPKYDMRQRAVTGTEALVRWNHPTRGMIFPDVFITMAEETGHIRALTEWVVRRAIDDQRALAERGHEISVAVNISGRVLGEPDFVDFCAEVLKDAVGKVCFEVTETAVIENPEVALAMLDAFADMGVSISIDDYGSGLSSLAYLKQIRGQELKLDRSIVKDVTVSQRDALIVRSTIDLAHSLGLKVVAEGIETEDCFSVLVAMGCDMAQGYLIARPQPLDQLFDFLAEDQAQVRNRA